MNIIMKSFDTLKTYERLKKAKTSEAQAKEIAEILGEIVDDQLATRNDLKKTEANLQSDLQKTEAKLQTDIKKLESEMKNTEANLQAEIHKSKTELLKWVMGMLVAQTGMLMSFIKFAI